MNPYTRLPGKARPHFGFGQARHAIYRAEDHVLSVMRSGYKESYRRFYWKDIQALTCTKTATGRLASLGFLIITAALLALGFLMLDTEYAWSCSIFWGIAAVTALLLLCNLLLGATCATYLHTSAEIHRLPCLGRWRKAQKSLAILTAAIEARQGRISPEWLNSEESQTHSIRTGTHAAIYKQGLAQKKPIAISLRWHYCFFVLLALLGLSHGIDTQLQSSLKNILDTILFPALMVFWAMSAVQQSKTSRYPQTRIMLHLCLAVLFLNYMFFSLATGLRMGFWMNGFGNDFEFFSLGSASLIIYCYCIFTVFLSLGVLGAMILSMERLNAMSLAQGSKEEVPRTVPDMDLSLDEQKEENETPVSSENDSVSPETDGAEQEEL